MVEHTHQKGFWTDFYKSLVLQYLNYQIYLHLPLRCGTIMDRSRGNQSNDKNHKNTLYQEIASESLQYNR